MAAASVLLVHVISFLLLFRVEIWRKENSTGSGTQVLSSPDGSTVKPLHQRLDSEDDDSEIFHDSYRMYRLRQVTSGPPVNSYAPELKYIETKVWFECTSFEIWFNSAGTWFSILCQIFLLRLLLLIETLFEEEVRSSNQKCWYRNNSRSLLNDVQETSSQN